MSSSPTSVSCWLNGALSFLLSLSDVKIACFFSSSLESRPDSLISVFTSWYNSYAGAFSPVYQLSEAPKLTKSNWCKPDFRFFLSLLSCFSQLMYRERAETCSFFQWWGISWEFVAGQTLDEEKPANPRLLPSELFSFLIESGGEKPVWKWRWYAGRFSQADLSWTSLFCTTTTTTDAAAAAAAATKLCGYLHCSFCLFWLIFWHEWKLSSGYRLTCLSQVCSGWPMWCVSAPKKLTRHWVVRYLHVSTFSLPSVPGSKVSDFWEFGREKMSLVIFPLISLLADFLTLANPLINDTWKGWFFVWRGKLPVGKGLEKPLQVHKVSSHPQLPYWIRRESPATSVNFFFTTAELMSLADG